jgi:hypothetical protein
MLVRHIEPPDIPAIARVVEEAFGRSDERMLVDDIRANGDAVIEAVAAERPTCIKTQGPRRLKKETPRPTPAHHAQRRRASGAISRRNPFLPLSRTQDPVSNPG